MPNNNKEFKEGRYDEAKTFNDSLSNNLFTLSKI